MSATPIPWKVDDQDIRDANGNAVIYNGSEGGFNGITKQDNDEIRALIVRAVNTHDALVEALAAVAKLTRFELPELNNTDQWKRNLIDIDHIVQAAIRQAGR